ncbi:hypothetical protein GGR21_003622 [Dysgonomonas hofstadii]|uniref:Uncharacterized protein n=1 Tax=Dysgonomonas hofstadii TaxID=637886 RepID=A0A840CRM2_9BACT|nr:hypothetical protein [Dysgonomonas hofstadii]MBB4037701.1 hypothetical protein [Dysgonomonas hofstadii]
MKMNNKHDSESECTCNELKEHDTSHIGQGRGTKNEKESLNPHKELALKDRMQNHCRPYPSSDDIQESKNRIKVDIRTNDISKLRNNMSDESKG